MKDATKYIVNGKRFKLEPSIEEIETAKFIKDKCMEEIKHT